MAQSTIYESFSLRCARSSHKSSQGGGGVEEAFFCYFSALPAFWVGGFGPSRDGQPAGCEVVPSPCLGIRMRRTRAEDG